MRFFFLMIVLTPNVFYTQQSLNLLPMLNVSFIKQTYQADEPIILNISIQNNNQTPISFVISDIIEQSIKFELKTSRNENIPVNHISSARLTDIYANPALYRTITLLPGETFSRVFDIRNIYDISSYEAFYIRSVFYPNPDNRKIQVESDFTTFSHTISTKMASQIVNDTITRNQELDLLVSLLPNEIIQQFFDAQFAKDWEKFLLYINVERLLQSFQNYASQYNQATNAEFKLQLLNDFRRFLTTHWNIPLISYSINETIIQDGLAYVTVDAMESIRFTHRRVRYTFTLSRSGSGAWLITDYTVLALN